METSYYHPGVKCRVAQIAYHHFGCLGTLVVPRGHRTDLKGTVDLFYLMSAGEVSTIAIIERVSRLRFFSKGKDLILYYYYIASDLTWKCYDVPADEEMSIEDLPKNVLKFPKDD